jgi:hypothetical protein
VNASTRHATASAQPRSSAQTRNLESCGAVQGWISGALASLAVGGFALSAGLVAIKPWATASRSAAFKIVWQYLTVRDESGEPPL